MKNEMLGVDEVATRIRNGDILVIAGEEALLAKLPPGRWIGGTTVYFVTETGGAVVTDRLFCTTFSSATKAVPRYLGPDDLAKIPQGYHEHGFTMVMMPAFSQAHSEFAIHGAGYAGLFDQPLMGWVTGVHLTEIGQRKPKVFDGSGGGGHDDGVVLLHISLPEAENADLDILNIFSQGDNPDTTFVFEVNGFTAREALVNGQRVALAAYLRDKSVELQLPLVANYSGALVNVSIQSIDHDTGEVKFYAPVVAGVEYRQAKGLGDYAKAFAGSAGQGGAAQYSCNCILNYLYGELDGKKTGDFVGPVTFGEIAYILLNQTLVHMEIKAA